jgi:hypothetical protein
MSKPHSSMVDSARRLAELREGQPEPPPAEAAEEQESVEEERLPSYSVVSADRQRKLMVEFRLLTGNSKARAYSYLVAADFDPSQGIVLDFSADKVTIKGRNLRPLYDALVAQRVAVVRELDELQAKASGIQEKATVVTKIEIAEVEPLEPGVKGTPAR